LGQKSACGKSSASIRQSHRCAGGGDGEGGSEGGEGGGGAVVMETLRREGRPVESPAEQKTKT